MTSTAQIALRIVAPVAAILLPLAFGCDTSDSMPGTALGTFSISAALDSNTCGTGLGAPDPWTFEIELSKDGTTLYWRQDGSTVHGTIDDDEASFSGSTSSQVVASTDTAVGCTMKRSDSTTIELAGSGADITSVSGTISFTFSVVSGSDCSSQLSASGGAYDTLPCTSKYTFTGTKK